MHAGAPARLHEALPRTGRQRIHCGSLLPIRGMIRTDQRWRQRHASATSSCPCTLAHPVSHFYFAFLLIFINAGTAPPSPRHPMTISRDRPDHPSSRSLVFTLQSYSGHSGKSNSPTPIATPPARLARLLQSVDEAGLPHPHIAINIL